MAEFTYMGTKKGLADQIARTARSLPEGAFLDLFSGISAAGASIGETRQVWCNDVQAFSRTLTQALYTSKEEKQYAHIIDRVVRHGNLNLNALLDYAYEAFEVESRALFEDDVSKQLNIQYELKDTLVGREHELRAAGVACLFSTRYVGTYLGLAQCLQLDSIRYGADQALAAKEISLEDHRWAILALCRSLATLSNSTGHFAQYLTPQAKNINRVVTKRRQCAWEHWSSAVKELQPQGSVSWRKKNKVFSGDANVVLGNLSSGRHRPSVIYADPPYTDDQYSRFYHLLDTAVLYDYPSTTGKGQYRDDRFRSDFSLKTQVAGAFERLIEGAANLRSSLIISYPSNGLLSNSLEQIPTLLKQSFRYVRKPVIISHHHSTMGASKGRQRESVEECIFVARP